MRNEMYNKVLFLEDFDFLLPFSPTSWLPSIYNFSAEFFGLKPYVFFFFFFFFSLAKDLA